MAAASHPAAGQAPAVVPCQANTTYDLDGFTLWSGNGMSSDGLGCITVTASSVTWNTSMKVRGTVRVLAGRILRITTPANSPRTVIEFADMRQTVTQAQLAPPYNRATRIVVEKRVAPFTEGGFLQVDENVTLTSLQGCPNSMWDGIVLQGAATASGQSPTPNQLNLFGKCYLGSPFTTNSALRSVVANARIAVLAGRPQYSSTTGELLSSFADGGGVVVARNADFLNCHTGVRLLDYPFYANKCDLSGCNFLCDAPLADLLYTSGGIRYGTQLHVYMSNILAVSFTANTFSLTDANAAFNNTQLPYTLRGTGIALNNASAIVDGIGTQANTFRRLSNGISANNPNPSYTLFVRGAKFENNYTGIAASEVNNAVIVENEFRVGRFTDPYAIGIRMYASTGYSITRNTFAAGYPWPVPPPPNGEQGIVRGIRGLEIFATDLALGGGNGKQDRAYRNRFEQLFDGIYVATADRPAVPATTPATTVPKGNLGLQITCNDFRTGATSGTVGTITGTNLLTHVRQGNSPYTLQNRIQGLPDQGSCVLSNDPKYLTAPAGNLFSHGTGCPAGTRDIQQIGGGAVVFEYRHHPEIAAFPTRPGGSQGCLNLASATRDQCTAILNGLTFDDFCPEFRETSLATEAALLAQADTAAAAADRQAAIDELLRRYLHDTADVRGGVDAAIALLTQLDEPTYAAQRQALLDRSGSTAQRPAGAGAGYATAPGEATGNGRTAARRAARPRSALSAAAAVAQARTLYADYSDRIQALLAPYATDSAAQEALRTSAPLRAEIEAIARDSTQFGFTEGRAVLTQYLGYRFVDGRLDAVEADATGQRTAPSTPGERPVVATFYPNPTADGHLRVAYALPPAAQTARLELTDRYGITRLTQALKAHAAEAELNLSALPAGLYYYRLRVGEEVVQSGTLVRLP